MCPIFLYSIYGDNANTDEVRAFIQQFIFILLITKYEIIPAIKYIDKYVRFIAAAAFPIITANIFIMNNPTLCIMDAVKS